MRYIGLYIDFEMVISTLHAGHWDIIFMFAVRFLLCYLDRVKTNFKGVLRPMKDA